MKCRAGAGCRRSVLAARIVRDGERVRGLGLARTRRDRPCGPVSPVPPRSGGTLTLCGDLPESL